MKRVVSVSIGSSKRDHQAIVRLGGEEFSVERVGTDGDIGKAIDLIRDLDGKVAAFGMGGIDLYLVGGNRRYILREAKKIARAAQKTPIVDGSGLKNTLERRTIQYLAEHERGFFSSTKVLLTCAVDRFGMAEALQETGAEVLYGDFMFILGIPFPLYSLQALGLAARIAAPLIVQLPFRMLYPIGQKQEEQPNKAKFAKYYEWADVIAGDFHLIRKYMPDNLQGKRIITNTVIEEDIHFLRERGISTLVTTTPNIDGRSFGTNVMEALLVALLERPVADITPADYLQLLDKVGFVPRIEHLEASESVL
ncbi:MAG: quinate 5-dehydrogenase [Firmicutes bacterium]|jgi:hypothetical protein|nr:quinate 5-dehydrogenase [Bacillota bacterium]